MCVCVCTSTLLAGAAVETDPAVGYSLLNISDVIIHDRNLKMNMSEINPVMSFLSFFLRHSIRTVKMINGTKKIFSFFKKKNRV